MKKIYSTPTLIKRANLTAITAVLPSGPPPPGP